MKKLVISVVLLSIAVVSKTQELPLQQYYLLNPYLLNPAVAGFSDQTEIRATFAQQWIGIANAPSTQSVSAHTYLGKGFGVGGYFFNDINGLNKETGINISGAYQIKLGYDTELLKIRQLSFGMGLTGFQHQIKINDFTPHNNDPAVDGAAKQGSAIEFNTGINFRYDRLTLGIAIARLGSDKLSVYSDATEPEIPLYISINSGYIVKALENIFVEPSMYFKFNTIGYKQLDFNIKTIFIPADDQQYWFALSLRNGFTPENSRLSELTGLLGLSYRGLMFIYAYDKGLTELAKSNSGTHQVMVGIQIRKSKKHKVICPVF